MLLAIDIGNSNISVGLFDQKRDLKFLSSIDTDSRKTADQISIDLMNIFSLYQYDLRDVSGAIFSSVVPPINFMMAKALTRLLGKPHDRWPRGQNRAQHPHGDSQPAGGGPGGRRRGRPG
mgnify:CR=1 FL=1